MKKNRYLILLIFLFAGCTKVIVDRRYEKKLKGTWEVISLKLLPGQGTNTNLNFKKGTYTFLENGVLNYTDEARKTYTGTWYADETERENCTTATDGVTQVCTKYWSLNLKLTKTDPVTQQVTATYFDKVYFYSNDHFAANTHTDYYSNFEFQFKRL